MPFFQNTPLRRWNGQEIGDPFLEQLVELATIHEMHNGLMLGRLEADAALGTLIRSEIVAEW